MRPRSLAMVSVSRERFERSDVALPDVGPDDALLRVERCGLCGTDLEQYYQGLMSPYPYIPGHEPVGVIAEIGDGAAARWGVDVGDRVVVEAALPCLECAQSARGRVPSVRAPTESRIHFRRRRAGSLGRLFGVPLSPSELVVAQDVEGRSTRRGGDVQRARVRRWLDPRVRSRGRPERLDPRCGSTRFGVGDRREDSRRKQCDRVRSCC